jgi:hypothetical protein
MTEPSWRQLARIPESRLKREILSALNIDPPPEAISMQFDMAQSGIIHFSPGAGFVWYRPALEPTWSGDPLPASRFLDGSDLLRETHAHPGTPTGDALRAWLRRWGWKPRNER